MSSAKKLKLGIIGCGLAANKLHWPVLQKLQDKIEITAVCNHTEKKAVDFADLIAASGVEAPNVYLDYKKLLQDENVDAVAILLPVELNYSVCTAAAAAGKHIMVEKPIAENLANAKKLLKLEKKYYNLTMMVAENMRYQPVYAALHEILAEGKIGAPYYVEWKCWQLVDPETNIWAGTEWRINHTYEGGFVTDGGVHNIAALRDVFGDLITIGAIKTDVNPNIGRTDTLVYLFKSEGKGELPPVSGVLNLGFSVKGKSEFSLQVLGSTGYADVEGTTIKLFNTEGKEPFFTKDYPDEGGYYNQYLDLLDSIKNNKKPISSFDQAFYDLKTILGALSKAEKV